MIDLSSIRDAVVLRGLTDPDLEKLGGIARERNAKKGDRLFSRGVEADTFFIVKDGRFALTVPLRALDREVETAVEEEVAGDAFGWSALVEPRRSIYSAYCTADGSVLAFPGADLEELMSSEEGLGYRFSRNLSQLVGSRVRVLQDLWIEEVEQSMQRVSYWTHSKVCDDWVAAVRPLRKRRSTQRRSSP